MLSNLVENIKCSECEQKCLQIKICDVKFGSCNKLELRCSKCDETKASTYSSKRCSGKFS